MASMMWWDRLIEDRVKTAQERGLFDNLRNQGRRLDLDDSSGEDWLANHVLKENGLLPDWLELRKEIHEERRVVLAALREYEEAAARLDPRKPGTAAILARLEERYAKAAREINRKIDEHNVRCPSMAHELVRFQEDLIARRRRAR